MPLGSLRQVDASPATDWERLFLAFAGRRSERATSFRAVSDSVLPWTPLGWKFELGGHHDWIFSRGRPAGGHCVFSGERRGPEGAPLPAGNQSASWMMVQTLEWWTWPTSGGLNRLGSRMILQPPTTKLAMRQFEDSLVFRNRRYDVSFPKVPDFVFARQLRSFIGAIQGSLSETASRSRVLTLLRLHHTGSVEEGSGGGCQHRSWRGRALPAPPPHRHSSANHQAPSRVRRLRALRLQFQSERHFAAWSSDPPRLGRVASSLPPASRGCHW